MRKLHYSYARVWFSLGEFMVGQFISNLGISDWIAVVSTVIAALTSFIAFLYGLAARKSERRVRNLESQVSRIDRELIVWGIRCIDTMSSGHILLATAGSGRQSSEVRVLRDEIQSVLSALVDMGRLYFPNRNPDLVGIDRPLAFRGFRPAILDAVMLVHDELRQATTFDNEEAKQAAQNAFEARRAFISEFQEEIDRFRDKRALQTLRITDDDWTEIAKLVDNFEARKGLKSFWKERPRPRHELLAEWRETRGRSRTA